MRSTCGIVIRTAPVTNAFAMSVVPTPNATQPRRAAVRGVRIGADDELPRQRVALGHDRVRDTFGAGVPRIACIEIALQITVLDQSMASHERPMRGRHRAHATHEAPAHVHRTAMHVGHVIFERDDGARIVKDELRTERFLQQVCAHPGVVLVDVAEVGADEAALARVEAPRRVRCFDRVVRDNFLE
jgi:hypothetical protein